MAVTAAIVFGQTGLLRNLTGGPSSSGTTGESVYLEQLKEGDCIRDITPADSGDAVTRVDCSKKHLDEVYAIFDLPQRRWPGETVVERGADQGCNDRFAPYVGKSEDDSDLEISEYYPLEETWSADHRVICILEIPGDSTGTMRGSGR
ncbi:MAG: septum formation family protein [Marmoricola sp.]|nr:septum formation family protein [Marmoricola sp.]